MTLPAGGEDVGFRQVRRRIGRRQHVVMAVTVVAGGHGRSHVRLAERHGLAVVGIPVMRQPVLVAFTAARVADGLEVVSFRLLNLVRRVTIRADRAALVAPGQQLAMDALKVGFLNADVALAAGFGDVGVVDGRVAVHSALDVMHAVAVVAGRRDNQSHLQERAAVDAFHVLRCGLRKLHLVFLRQPGIAVAPGAGLREVQLENRRRRVLHRQNAMRAVTIPAIGGARSSQLVAQAVDARGVIFRLLCMASVTVRRRQFALMHQVLDAGVAIHTVEHGMDGFLKGVGRKKQRNDFPVHLAGRGRVQVAVEAVGVFEFVRGIRGEQTQAKAKAEKEDAEPVTVPCWWGERTREPAYGKAGLRGFEWNVPPHPDPLPQLRWRRGRKMEPARGDARPTRNAGGRDACATLPAIRLAAFTALRCGSHNRSGHNPRRGA